MESLLLNLWRRFHTLAKLFRFVELLTVLVLFLWMSSRLPFALRISGEYFRTTAALVFCPASIFVLGNAIVVTLLAKSGLFSSSHDSSAVDIAVAEFYRKLQSDDVQDHVKTSPFLAQTEVVFQDKEVIVCEHSIPLVNNHNHNVNDVKNDEDVFPEEKKKDASYRRSQSEKFESNDKSKEKDKLRRSETDVCRRSEIKETAETEKEEVDGGEEFRRTIEAFIAKQVRFHREESLAVVLHGQA
ncbi:hypothetical protein vseg_005011 [Gypsophila vaccaria]